jgi:hypothetical protein
MIPVLQRKRDTKFVSKIRQRTNPYILICVNQSATLDQERYAGIIQDAVNVDSLVNQPDPMIISLHNEINSLVMNNHIGIGLELLPRISKLCSC